MVINKKQDVLEVGKFQSVNIVPKIMLLATYCSATKDFMLLNILSVYRQIL